MRITILRRHVFGIILYISIFCINIFCLILTCELILRPFSTYQLLIVFMIIFVYLFFPYYVADKLFSLNKCHRMIEMFYLKSRSFIMQFLMFSKLFCYQYLYNWYQIIINVCKTYFDIVFIHIFLSCIWLFNICLSNQS